MKIPKPGSAEDIFIRTVSCLVGSIITTIIIELLGVI